MSIAADYPGGAGDLRRRGVGPQLQRSGLQAQQRQAMGEHVGPASDLYSLGVILYEMLTGELPFTADNSIAVCMKHVTEPLRPPHQLNPLVPEGIDALVVMLLAKRPADRYASAGVLVYAICPGPTKSEMWMEGGGLLVLERRRVHRPVRVRSVMRPTLSRIRGLSSGQADVPAG